MGNFWKLVGKAFLKAGLWASQHPEVIKIAEQAVNDARKS